MDTEIQVPVSVLEVQQQFPDILPPWTTDSVWQDTVASLVNFPLGVSVLELCAGAGTASIALKLILGQDEAVLAGAWDISLGFPPSSGPSMATWTARSTWARVGGAS